MRMIIVGAALLCASLTTAADAAYSRMFVFGDSLTDNGNAFLATGGEIEVVPYTDAIPDRPYAPSSPGAFGVLSNGPVWLDRLGPAVTPVTPPPALALLQTLDLSAGANFAFGGARSGPLPGVTPDGIPTLLTQAQSLVTLLPSVPTDALYVVWAGGNDLRDALEHPAAAVDIMQQGLFNVGDVLGTLGASGARNFLVLNMPDLSRTPAVAGLGQATQAAAQNLIENYNLGLAGVIAEFEQDLGIDVLTVDVFDLITQVLNAPADFGFSNTTTPCIFENGAIGCTNPDDYFFWDALHPTAAVHQLIANAVTATVAPVPLPAAWPLLLSALAIPAALRRRHPQPRAA